jgi:hypothetical protein
MTWGVLTKPLRTPSSLLVFGCRSSSWMDTLQALCYGCVLLWCGDTSVDKLPSIVPWPISFLSTLLHTRMLKSAFAERWQLWDEWEQRSSGPSLESQTRINRGWQMPLCLHTHRASG